MNCPRHPQKRTVTACKDCGAGFCIDCVRETDQTTLCPECYRRKLGELAREYAEEPAKTSIPIPKEAPRRNEPAAAMETIPQAEKARRGRAARKQELEARRKRLLERPPRAFPPDIEEETAPSVRTQEWPAKPVAPSVEEKISAEPSEDEFLSRGPDQDFSFLEPEKKEKKEKKEKGRWISAPRDRKKAPEAAAEEPILQEPVQQERSKAAAVPASDDLISDVVSTLLMPGAEEGFIEEIEPEELPAEEIPEEIPARRPRQKPERKKREKPQKVQAPKRTAEEIRATREERAERWAFLAQPRTSEYTAIAGSKPRAAGFVALTLLGGALLWALPNAYLIPKDTEYGIHSFLIGVIIGLLFWWKAGKKHSNKLAIQAALVTFFSLFIGEFLHSFLIVMKNQALRTIFFDLISFKFLWQNGATLLHKYLDAMFPLAFLWILLLPAAIAFIIGFGMPPIPEIFFQIGRAMKGEARAGEDAGHGLEN